MKFFTNILWFCNETEFNDDLDQLSEHKQVFVVLSQI